VAASAQQTRPSGGSGARLAGIDGLRAFAALWVVFFHIQAFSMARFPGVPGLDLVLRSGSTGVSLFLVLSGLCLYLPFAGERITRFAPRQFFARRSRRLLPAYYTSLAIIFLITLAAGPAIGLESLSPADAISQLFTHATLTHTFFPDTFYALNGAYWSLGLEWQLYLSLPLLIWGIRRFGIKRTAIAVVACNVVYRLVVALLIARGVVPAHSTLADAVLPNLLPGRWSEFILGMIAAELYVRGQIVPWARIARFLILPLIPLSLLANSLPIAHLFYGSLFFCVVSLVLAADNVVARIFAWRPLVAVGVMSYSLYLVHQPVVQAIAYLTHVRSGLSPTLTFFVLVGYLPLILGLAWLLFVTVEKRTLHSAPAARRSGAMLRGWLGLPSRAALSSLPGVAALRGWLSVGTGCHDSRGFASRGISRLGRRV
jgi:peptidoglycan/LPS O-acetylase OafA/YrhL